MILQRTLSTATTSRRRTRRALLMTERGFLDTGAISGHRVARSGVMIQRPETTRRYDDTALGSNGRTIDNGRASGHGEHESNPRAGYHPGQQCPGDPGNYGGPAAPQSRPHTVQNRRGT